MSGNGKRQRALARFGRAMKLMASPVSDSAFRAILACLRLQVSGDVGNKVRFDSLVKVHRVEGTTRSNYPR